MSDSDIPYATRIVDCGLGWIRQVVRIHTHEQCMSWYDSAVADVTPWLPDATQILMTRIADSDTVGDLDGGLGYDRRLTRIAVSRRRRRSRCCRHRGGGHRGGGAWVVVVVVAAAAAGAAAVGEEVPPAQTPLRPPPLARPLEPP